MRTLFKAAAKVVSLFMSRDNELDQLWLKCRELQMENKHLSDVISELCAERGQLFSPAASKTQAQA